MMVSSLENNIVSGNVQRGLRLWDMTSVVPGQSSATVDGNTITHNNGGGVYNDRGTLTISNIGSSGQDGVSVDPPAN